MKPSVKLGVILIGVAILGYGFPAVNSADAQSTLALQKKCAEEGEKFFFERINLYGGSWGSFSHEKGHGYNDFTTHYNRKFGKCFIRIEYSYFPKDKGEKSIKAFEIYDIFAGKRIASCSLRILSPLDCKVGDKTCNSLSEFETLTKPYMKSNGEVRGADWKYFEAGRDSTFWWYDTEGVTYHTNRTIQVWVKKIKIDEIEGVVDSGAKSAVSQLEQMALERDYKQLLLEIDCVEKTVKGLQELNYSAKGVLKSGESMLDTKKGIPAGSVAEKLYKIVCKEVGKEVTP